jgi:hypothetical protein
MPELQIIQNPKPWGVCVWFARIYLELSGMKRVCDSQDGAYHIQAFRPLPQGVIWFRHFLIPYPSFKAIGGHKFHIHGCDL